MEQHFKPWFAITIPVFLGLAAIALFFQPVRAAGLWYVGNAGSDTNDCQTSSTPCATINGAIGKAVPEDIVYVAAGTYTVTAGSQVVLIDKNITLAGGWNNSYTQQDGYSVIDGQGERVGLYVDSNITAVASFLTIQNGYGAADSGGGVRNFGSLTLNNSAIINNTTNSSVLLTGGGIYNPGSLTLNNSQVSGNTTVGYGGAGIDNQGSAVLNNSTVSNNQIMGYRTSRLSERA